MKPLLLCIALLALVQTGLSQQRSLLNDVRFSGLFFLNYEFEDGPEGYSNEFLLKRGYITFQSRLSEKVGVRFTQDVTIDQEGDGEGDIELRLKYAFVSYSFDNTRVFFKPVVEFGVVRRPWTDFEQRINDFRMQGSMFLDREKISASADYGITFVSLLGPPIENARELNLHPSYAGKYGSIGFGIYNGGGYAELEKNTNKLIEGQLTVRPLWNRLPGLQLTYAGSFGKGNIEQSPDFWKHLGFISYSSPRFVGTFQYYYGKGNLLGSKVYPNNEPIYLRDGFYVRNNFSLPMQGTSTFGEVTPFNIPLIFTARFDWLENRETSLNIRQRTIVGIAWRFPNGSKIMLDFEQEYAYPRSWQYLPNENPGSKMLFRRFELGTEIRF